MNAQCEAFSRAGAGAASRSTSWLRLKWKTKSTNRVGVVRRYVAVSFQMLVFGRPQWGFERHFVDGFGTPLVHLLLLRCIVAVFTLLSHLALLYRDADICVLISSLLNTGDANSECTRVLSFERWFRRRRRLIWKWKTCFNHEDWVHVSGDLDTRHEELEYRPPSALWPWLHDRYWHTSRRSSYSLICPPGVEVVFNALVHDDMNVSNS